MNLGNLLVGGSSSLDRASHLWSAHSMTVVHYRISVTMCVMPFKIPTLPRHQYMMLLQVAFIFYLISLPMINSPCLIMPFQSQSHSVISLTTLAKQSRILDNVRPQPKKSKQSTTIKLGNWFLFLQAKRHLGVSGHVRSNIMSMNPLSVSKLAL